MRSVSESVDKSSRKVVLDAVKELHAQEQIVTRETLHEQTGIKYGVLDDRLSALVDDGEILRVQKGVYIPAPELRPNRPITKTIIPGGWVKLEVGDDYAITLSPSENRALGELMAGAGQQFAAIELGHHAAIMASSLQPRVLRLERIASTADNELGLSGVVRELVRKVRKLEQLVPQSELDLGVNLDNPVANS